MSEFGFILLLYTLGTLVLVAEIFIPSHGVLCVTGVGLLVAAVVQTFQHAGREAGVVALLGCLVLVPSLALLAVKYWHRTPIGRLISPPNPTLTRDDIGVPVDELREMVGSVGRTVSPLRPVGIADFGGKRVSCVAESGMIDAGEPVQAIDVLGGNLQVAIRKG